MPGMADKIGHFLMPRGPAGRFHTVGPFTDCITSYSQNKDVAQDYIRYCHQKEVYEKFLVTNKGYINGPLPQWQEHPMWESDPVSPFSANCPSMDAILAMPGPTTARPRRCGPSTSSWTCLPRW